MTKNKYSLKPDRYLSHQGSYCSWPSKVSDNTKHGFYKRNEKPSSEEVIIDCFLSRVLNKRDEMSGLPVTERTPKNKILFYKTSSTDDTGKSYYYTVSRVMGLEGKPPTDTVSGYDLASYLQNGSGGDRPLSGMLNALVDAVLVGRWDLKTQNLSAPNVRNFDMSMALGGYSGGGTYCKNWNKKDFTALVKGGASGSNKMISKYKLGTTEALAHAFTQMLADFGTRVNKYYLNGYPIYSDSQEGMKKKNFSTVFNAVKKDINDSIQDGEEPTQAVLRIFKERAEGIRGAVYTTQKNPRVEVLHEIRKANAPERHGKYIEHAEKKLIKSLAKIEEFVEELYNSTKKWESPTSVITRKRTYDESFGESDKKRAAVSTEEEPVEMFGMMFHPITDSRSSRISNNFLEYKSR